MKKHKHRPGPSAKRIMLVGDFHSGSVAGLTPFPANEIQEVVFKNYEDCIAHFGEGPDILICNGDLVDGSQIKGRELGDDDWLETQMRNACVLVKMWRAKEVMLVAGTQYHVSSGTIDMEAMISHMLLEGGTPAHFTRKLNLRVNDWFKIQARHHIGSSGIPHGRNTAQNRSKFWGVLNAALGGGTWPHLSVFSHVHYYSFSEDAWGAVMTLPAWQAVGSRFGSERCDGHCDIGAVQVTVEPKSEGGWKWEKRLYQAAVADRSIKR